MATAPSVPTRIERRPIIHRTHRPWLAALLSFIFPGLGQAYAGNTRRALIFGIPVVLLITGVLVLVGVFGETLRNALLSSGFLFAVLAVNLVFFAWRAFAIVDAGVGGRGGRFRAVGDRRATLAAVAALVLLTGVMHGWVAVVVGRLDDTLAQVFEPGDGTDGGVAVPAASGDSVPTPEPTPDYHWDGEERINFLLLGTDAAPGREEILTDVVLVLSMDPVARTAAMISVPRDTGYVPLPDDRIYAGGVFPGKANELASVAAADPDLWCRDDRDITRVACGIRTVQEAIGLYVGLDLQYYALVDMAGFAELIDALGGVELCLPGRLVDPLFGDSLRPDATGGPLVLPAGCNHYDGITALAYARSRQGHIELPDGSRLPQTDFDRNERQQRLLLAMREEMAGADIFADLPDVLAVLGRTVDTDFPRDQAGDLASLLPLITGPDIERVVLDYPQFVDAPSEPEVNSLLEPRRDAIREEMARLFGEDELRGWYLGTVRPTP